VNVGGMPTRVGYTRKTSDPARGNQKVIARHNDCSGRGTQQALFRELHAYRKLLVLVSKAWMADAHNHTRGAELLLRVFSCSWSALAVATSHLKLHELVPLRGPCQTLDENCTELVPILRAVALQLHTPTFELSAEAFSSPLRLQSPSGCKSL